jgi:cytochrome P450
MCIGQHIALFEMKKYLAELLNRFDVSFIMVSPPRPQEMLLSANESWSGLQVD